MCNYKITVEVINDDCESLWAASWVFREKDSEKEIRVQDINWGQMSGFVLAGE